MPSQDPIVRAFSRIVARDGGRLLVVARGRRASASDVDALARVLARVLAAGPLHAGGPVGLQVPNGPAFLAALLDHQMTRLEVAGIGVTLGLAGIVRCADGWAKDDRDVVVETLPGTASALPGPASIIKLTSGSAGRPRGVATSSEALLADDVALRRSMGILDADRLLAMLPFSHSYGLSSLVIPSLTQGLCLVLPDLVDPVGPVTAAHAFDATVLPTVPAWIAAVLRLEAPPLLPRSLRLVVSAGAPLPADRAWAFRERLGVGVHAFYGATESGGIAYDASGTAAERGTVGEPIEGVEVSFEPAGGIEHESGGRLIVRSPALGAYYVPDPDPDLGPDGFRTADLVVRRGAELQIAGRLDAVINLRGRKVDPTEVERVIAGLDSVEDVVVHALPGAVPGEDNLRAVVSCPPGPLTADAVVAWCRERLAPFKIPRRVLIVRDLPRTARGKVDRAAVARLDGGGGRNHA